MASEDEADALYGLELSEFTPARTELVKRLKTDGERERAAEVGKLRKPTVAAWVVNHVARDAPDDVAALLEKGEALRRFFERVTLYWDKTFHPASQRPTRKRKTNRPGRNRYALNLERISWGFATSELNAYW